MNKSIFPNMLTSANLGFGVLGITFSAVGEPIYAAICVLLSLLADGCDGRVARALGVSGPMGRELDSLADVVGFGVAPAFMLYSKELFQLGWYAYIPLLIFSILGAFRLARFNIMTDEVHGYFQGLPIPAAGCLAATYVLCGVMLPQWLLFCLMIFVGYLMVSNVKYPDFKGHSVIKNNKIAITLTALFAIGVLVYDWHAWAVDIFASYVVFGLLNEGFNNLAKIIRFK